MSMWPSLRDLEYWKTADHAVVSVGLMRPRPGTAARNQQLPEGQPNIAGSCMMYVMPDLDAVWERLKEDVYWTADIWDKDRVIVEELLD